MGVSFALPQNLDLYLQLSGYLSDSSKIAKSRVLPPITPKTRVHAIAVGLTAWYQSRWLFSFLNSYPETEFLLYIP